MEVRLDFEWDKFSSIIFIFFGSEETRWTLDFKWRECFALNDMKLK
jgi:hypothetical protein